MHRSDGQCLIWDILLNSCVFCCVRASSRGSKGRHCASRCMFWSGTELLLHHHHSSEEVLGLFGALIRTAGAWAAARLRGGWERARPLQTQEGLLHLLSCRPPPPSIPSSSVLCQLRAAGETAGRCYMGERRVRVCLCVCKELGGGRPISNDITAKGTMNASH